MRMKGKRYCSADATGVYAAFSFLSLSFLAAGLCPHWSVTTIGCGDISFFGGRRIRGVLLPSPPFDRGALYEETDQE